MKLVIDKTREITVWAFPDESNPKLNVPYVLSGEKPITETDPELIVFDRIILKQKLTKSITVRT